VEQVLLEAIFVSHGDGTVVEEIASPMLPLPACCGSSAGVYVLDSADVMVVKPHHQDDFRVFLHRVSTGKFRDNLYRRVSSPLRGRHGCRQ
jgi:hypothetical protein